MADQTNLAKGTEYELFTQYIYQTLLEAEGVDNIEVKHDISVVGKSGCKHQIDVYWEFKLAGQIFRTAIECKAFDKTVTIGRVRDFYGVLADVPGLSGIFVTLVGYQSGAKKYADHYGIGLRELREPTNADWKGRVKTIVFNTHVIINEIVNFEPIVSQSFLDQTEPDERIEIQSRISNYEKIVLDPQGTPLLSYEEMRQMLPNGQRSETGLKHRMDLPKHSILLSGRHFPIDGINFVYDANITTSTMTIDGTSIISAVLKDALSGDLKVITKLGEVREPRK